MTLRTHGLTGALPRDPSREILDVGPHIFGSAPSEAHYGHIPAIGMLGNADWGDCVFAGVGHSAEAQSFYGQGTEVVLDDTDVLDGYSEETGFDPDAGPPGDNPTDNGAELVQGYDYYHKVGFGGVTVDAYGTLDHTNTNQWQQALAQCGPLLIGVGVGEAEEIAFDNGTPWDLTPHQSAAEENHAVLLCGYYASGLYFVYTWGGLQAVTQRWYRGAVYEAYVGVSRGWVNKISGRDPFGVNLKTLGQEYSALTGKPSPF